MPDWPTMSPLFRLSPSGHLRVVHLADVAEQVRRHRVGILPRRHLLDDDVGQLEVEPPGRHRRHLRERRVLHDHDRPVGRLAAVPIDDLAHAALLEAEHRRQQPDRAVQILRVLADDRDAVGVPVLDEHVAVAVEHHAARRAQRERPLVVVLGELGELLVLDDLQHPEAHGQDREQQRDDVLQDAQSNRDLSPIFS